MGNRGLLIARNIKRESRDGIGGSERLAFGNQSEGKLLVGKRLHGALGESAGNRGPRPRKRHGELSFAIRLPTD